MLKPKLGDIVYVNNAWTVAEKCEVTEIGDKDADDEYFYVHSLDNVGSFCALRSDIYATKEEAIAAYQEKSAKNVEQYKKEIKGLKELLEFPLTHCLNGEEYTDYDAIEAYKIMASELTGIVLKDNK